MHNNQLLILPVCYYNIKFKTSCLIIFILITKYIIFVEYDYIINCLSG